MVLAVSAQWRVFQPGVYRTRKISILLPEPRAVRNGCDNHGRALVLHFVITVTYGKNHKDTKTQSKAASKNLFIAAFLCVFVSLCLCGSCIRHRICAPRLPRRRTSAQTA